MPKFRLFTGTAYGSWHYNTAQNSHNMHSFHFWLWKLSSHKSEIKFKDKGSDIFLDDNKNLNYFMFSTSIAVYWASAECHDSVWVVEFKFAT